MTSSYAARNPLEALDAAVVGIAQVLDAPRGSFADQILLDPECRIQIAFDIVLADIVE